jgi:hypothetical protein
VPARKISRERKSKKEKEKEDKRIKVRERSGLRPHLKKLLEKRKLDKENLPLSFGKKKAVQRKPVPAAPEGGRWKKWSTWAGCLPLGINRRET